MMAAHTTSQEMERVETWIKATLYLGDAYKVFGISDRMRVVQLMPQCQTPAEACVLADWARDFFYSLRPELGGIIVVSISYDILQRRWLFGCLHDSFPRVPWGKESEVEMLVDEEAADHATGASCSTRLIGLDGCDQWGNK